MIQNKILKNIILKYVNKKFRNPVKQRNFLIDCIASSGYILQKEENQNMDSDDETNEIDEYEDLYAQFMPSESNNVNISKNEQELQQSLVEQSQSTIDPYGFNRTFITVNSHYADRLSELQKRGITYEETKFNQVKEEMEQLIEQPLKKNIDAPTDKILQTALNIFMNILIYYNTNPYGFTHMKGSLKKGYIFLCVYYAMIYNNQYIELEKLMEYADKTRLKDVPLALKNMKLIFENVQGYSSFLNKHYHGTINPGNFLKNTTNIKSKQLIKLIENVIEETKEFVPSTKLGIYSVIYFVCNEYLSYKIKIIYKGLETRVTYKVLDEVFGSYASATVRKITDQLLRIYRK